MDGEEQHKVAVVVVLALLILGLGGAVVAVGGGLTPLTVEQGQSFRTMGPDVLNINACGKVSLQQDDGVVLKFNEDGVCPYNGTIVLPFGTLKNLGAAIQLKPHQWNQRPVIVSNTGK